METKVKKGTFLCLFYIYSKNSIKKKRIRGARMGKIASDIGVASEAVTGITAVSVPKGTQVSFGKSTINSMKQGKEVNNQLLNNLSEVVECVKEQSQKFPKIAEIMAIEDSKMTF